MSFEKYALLYNQLYGLVVVFMSSKGVPLHEWRAYAETGMDAKTIEKTYFEIMRSKRNVSRLAIVTGRYMQELEKPMLVIDVDNIGDKDRDVLMKRFAKEGYQVVSTARGFHLHVFLEKNENLPYIIRLYREAETGKRESVGEGGCLFPHPWTTVPSRKLYKNRWVQYSFVLPDGSKIASYRKFIQNIRRLEPQTLTLGDVVEDLSLYLSAKVSFTKPMAGPVPKGMDREGVEKRYPLFRDLKEFYASVLSFYLPTCVAWVLYNYADAVGDSFTASAIGSYLQTIIGGLGKVPHGKRFLVAAAVALFLSHVIEWIKFDEILEVLQYGFEDWPEDEDGRLDKKLSYLFLVDEEGYVYPRYSGLGSLSPAQVMDCELCPYSRMCKGRNPWKAFARVQGKRVLAKTVYQGAEYEE